jgi:hypothetical protein
LTGLTRGSAGTTGVAHANGAKVQGGPSVIQFNNVNDIMNNVGASTWTVAPSGFSGSPTSSNCHYMQIGKFVACYIEISGTSNTTGFGFSLPVAAKKAVAITGCKYSDNSSGSITPGMITTSAGSATATCYTSYNSATWTAAGTKSIQQVFWYEAN